MYFKYLKDYVTLGDIIIMDKIVEHQVALCKMGKKGKRKRLKRRNIFYLDINNP